MADTDEGRSTIPGAVWFRETKPVRATPPLSRERIVVSAVELLDREGATGLSMRRLAAQLGVHPTSLYWHVATKNDVLDLALDAVFAEVGLPDEHHHRWRDDVVLYMTELRGVLLRHPWSSALASSRPLVGPNALARSEFVYAALVVAGFTGSDLAAAAAAVSNYVIGTTSSEAAWQHDEEAAARQTMVQHLQQRQSLYPTLAGHVTDLSSDWHAHFERGMTFLLDGLDTHRTTNR